MVEEAMTTTMSTRVATERLPDAMPCMPPRKMVSELAGTAARYQRAASGIRMYAGVTQSDVACMIRLLTAGLLTSVAGKNPHTAASDHATRVRSTSEGR